MAGISTAIQITDRVSAPMMSIISSLEATQNAFEKLGNSIDSNMDASSINTARQQLSAAVEQLSHVGDGIDNNTNKQEKFTRSVQETNGAFSSLGKTIMGLAVVQGVVNMVQNQVGSALQRMDTLNNYPKVMSNLGISAADAEASIQVLSENLKGLPTTLQDAATSVQRFTSANGNIGKSTDMFLALNNAILAGGADTMTQQSALEQLSQSYAKGKPDMMEWRSAMTAMPAQLNQVAQAMGYVSADALGESLRSGTESMDDFMNTLIALNEEGINGFPSFEEQARNATGGFITSIENMKSAITRGITDIVDKINQGLTKAGFGTLQEQIVNFGNTAETVLGNFGTLIGNLIVIMSPFLDIIVAVASFIVDNWSMIAPIVGGVVAAMMAYNAVLLAYNAISAISSIASAVHTAALEMETTGSFMAAAGQTSFNAALLACPITWIVIAIIAAIAVIIAFANYIAQAGGVATSTFGVICGWINVVIQFFKNLGLTVANIALGMWNALQALCHNMATAFSNSIANIQTFFYNLLSTALSVISQIASALSKLPFVEFDASGLSAAADNYAAKAAEAQANKGSYESLGDAFASGSDKFDTFQNGWVSDAYSQGASFGDGVSDKISNALDFGNTTSGVTDGLSNGALGNSYDTSQLASNVGDTAGNTAATADALSTTNEELKYLRDIAERDVVNRFTTANITVTQNNSNNISGDNDIDGITDTLSSGIMAAIDKATEGVHK